MRVFITGGTGFAGSHLVRQLLDAGHQLTALLHPASSHQDLPRASRVEPVTGDLLDLEWLKRAVAAARPDVIYHLAGQASPGRSWLDPAFTFAVNTGGTANLLEAAIVSGRPRVVVVTSAEIYGPVRQEMLPLDELTLPQPSHPYGVSKWAAGKLVSLYWRRYELPVIEARPFNHIGPNQALGFVVADFASQLARIKLGLQSERMIVGNLNSQRDFTDVRDVARAYRALAANGRPGEAYLICSGRSVSIQQLLDIMLDLIGVPVVVEQDTSLVRSSDTPRLFGSFDKIRNDTGWEPQVSLRHSLNDALNDWLDRLRED
jgi:GDP-4-dehydro-6-deoxy-D-mannose reductase